MNARIHILGNNEYENVSTMRNVLVNIMNFHTGLKVKKVRNLYLQSKGKNN